MNISDISIIYLAGIKTVINIAVNMHIDNEFWTTLQWPAAPNENDVDVFASYCTGNVLLLGSTKLLLPLATEAWDLEPKYTNSKIKNKDWFTLNEHWNTIIVDGALSFGKEFTEQLLSVVLPNCDRFVARTFLNPNWPTKYAIYFPRVNELTPQPEEHSINEVYTFYIWNK